MGSFGLAMAQIRARSDHKSSASALNQQQFARLYWQFEARGANSHRFVPGSRLGLGLMRGASRNQGIADYKS